MEKIANHKDIPGNPSTAKSSKLTLNKRTNGEPLNFLSVDQWDFWLENGYVIIKSAVSKNQAKKTASFLWEFEEKDPKNKDTWYTSPRAEMKMKELAGTGMVEVYNHQFLWENRQSEKIYKAFIDIWGTKDLWGDYDLLIGAYKNNLKILEVPVTYYERTGGETKMTNVFKNALRMFYIIICAFYKLRLQK